MPPGLREWRGWGSQGWRGGCSNWYRTSYQENQEDHIWSAWSSLQSGLQWLEQKRKKLGLLVSPSNSSPLPLIASLCISIDSGAPVSLGNYLRISTVHLATQDCLHIWSWWTFCDYRKTLVLIAEIPFTVFLGSLQQCGLHGLSHINYII